MWRIAIFVLMGFSAFVLDHGVLMLARGQAQNVADMAALAGATARAMDEPGPPIPRSNGHHREGDRARGQFAQ